MAIIGLEPHLKGDYKVIHYKDWDDILIINAEFYKEIVTGKGQITYIIVRSIL